MDTLTRLEALMSQSDHTDEDIIELARIRWELSQDAKQTDILANRTEEEYNLSRGREFVSIKAKHKQNGKRITDSEAERRAKMESEKRF